MALRSKTFGTVLGSLVLFAVAGNGCSSDPEEAPPPAPIQSAPNCGRLTTPCEAGGPCEGASDCKSGACRDAKCLDVAPADNTQNNDETDVDCGGTKAPACDDGKKCNVAADCKSGVCTGGVCQVPSPTDGVKNGDETGIDCGGAKAKKCPQGEGCLTTADCDNVKCDEVTKKCLGPSHEDGIKNLDETGPDCGGPTAPKRCATGEGCNGDDDCDNVRCDTTAKKCKAPANDDGLKNGTETDVDCGGGAPTNARRCNDFPTAESCDVDADCASTFCSFKKKCVTGRSCKGAVGSATAGIETCGRYESNNAAKQHESCCRSLPLPTTTTVKLDKYEVTSGRFRQFVESIPGQNIRKWVADEIAAATPTGQRLATDIPANMRDLLPASATPGDPLNVIIQTGALVMDTTEPSMSQGCYTDWDKANAQGAYVTGAYGHATYWWPQATLQAQVGPSQYPTTEPDPAKRPNKGRRFTREQYDEKSMNCTPYWLYAAFCAWDGGRLPTPAEVNEAWGATVYPWGTNTVSFPVGNDATDFNTTINYYNTNSGYFYGFPEFADARDEAGHIAAPGRFIKDKTTATSPGNGESWMDLGANLMEVTRYNTGGGCTTCGGAQQQGGSTFCDSSNLTGGLGACTGAGGEPGVIRATGMQTTLWVGGSFEGHFRFAKSPEPLFTKSSYNLRVFTQYGKTGVRCAR